MKIFFPENVDHLLYKRRMTASDLAKHLKLTRSTVAVWITGRGYPRMEKMLELVELFSVGLDDLMFKNLKEPDRPEGLMAAEEALEYGKLKREYEGVVKRLEDLERREKQRHGDATEGDNK